MTRSRWYENSILEWPWVLAAPISAIAAFVLASHFHWPWKDTLVGIIVLAFYVEFDVCTRQVERLMDRVKELEGRTRTMEAQARNAMRPGA